MDGRALARRIEDGVGRRAARLARRTGRRPCLAAVLVGDDPASETYVGMKRRRADAVGIEARVVRLPAATSTGQAVAAVAALSEDGGVDGILVQHPTPAHVDERAVFEAVAPTKDVDGVTTTSFGALALGRAGFVPCTPAGILRLLDAYDVELAGARAVVLGRSPILGLPVAQLLTARDATVTLCHSRTLDLEGIVARGDVVVAAPGGAGLPGLVRGAWIAPGAVVVDAGYARGPTGDVITEEALARARLVSPVPGGVGPMTIAVLLEQTVTAAERRATP
jgi:methylenetetrahydrofolate dehydrogenase (NADP+)/methenyltetrahydrofolate cyclohydrolase